MSQETRRFPCDWYVLFHLHFAHIQWQLVSVCVCLHLFIFLVSLRVLLLVVAVYRSTQHCINSITKMDTYNNLLPDLSTMAAAINGNGRPLKRSSVGIIQAECTLVNQMNWLCWWNWKCFTRLLSFSVFLSRAHTHTQTMKVYNLDTTMFVQFHCSKVAR